MKKGMELPINMIVIIALAVLILVIITAFTTSQVGQGVSSIDVERAFASACTELRTVNNCADAKVREIKENVQGMGEQTLLQLCERKGLIGTDGLTTPCRQACGCLV